MLYRWLLTESLIGNNPGVGVRPPTSDLHIDSSMYLLNSQDTDEKPTTPTGEGEKNIDYATRMDLFMKAYGNTTGLVECDGSDVSSLSNSSTEKNIFSYFFLFHVIFLLGEKQRKMHL